MRNAKRLFLLIVIFLGTNVWGGDRPAQDLPDTIGVTHKHLSLFSERAPGFRRMVLRALWDAAQDLLVDALHRRGYAVSRSATTANYYEVRARFAGGLKTPANWPDVGHDACLPFLPVLDTLFFESCSCPCDWPEEKLLRSCQDYMLTGAQSTQRKLMMAADSAAGLLPIRKPVPFRGDGSITVDVICDQFFRQAHPGDWQNRIRELVFMTSRLLETEVNCALKIDKIVSVTWDPVHNPTLLQIHRAIHKSYPSDNLVIALTFDTSIVSSLTARQQELGYAELARRKVTMWETPLRDKSLSHWWSAVNSRTLLHEIYHALGAVHVSDPSTIMNPVVTDRLAARLDPVNKAVVRASLRGDLPADDMAAYVKHVVAVAVDSAYGLVDIPELAYNYFRSKGLDPGSFDGFPEWVAMSAFGLQALSDGDRTTAARYFERALELDQSEASLYYYHALSGDLKREKGSLRTAASLGYGNAFQLMLDRGTTGDNMRESTTGD